MVARYFAYGSNMNPDRVRARGISFEHASPASLDGFSLTFDKTSAAHVGSGHANIAYAPHTRVEGVLYWLTGSDEIRRMDPFESTPVNYSREIVRVRVQRAHLPSLPVPDGFDDDEGVVLIPTWTYVANPAVRRPGLRPPKSYLAHLLAGRAFLSSDYVEMLEAWPCEEDR